ncbi:MAG TPA: TIGR04279 domain-containing protein [Methanosarcina sp.]
MKNKVEEDKIYNRRWKLTFAVLICIFSMISVSLAFSDNDPWVASVEKGGESFLFADHSGNQNEDNWIHLNGGKEIQLPQPLSFTYNGPDTLLTKEGATIKLKSESDNGNNTKIVFTYPYSTHPFYTENQKVKMNFYGSSAFNNQEVNIYLVKAFDAPCAKEILGNIVDCNATSVEKILDNSSIPYTKVSATLDENGDLVKPVNFGYLTPDSYGIIMTLADKDKEENTQPDSKEKNECKVLSATCFEVVDYELKTKATNTLKEGKNFDVDLSLIDTSAKENVTYGAMLIKKDAYKADINLSTNGTIDGTDLFINDISILSNLGIDSTNNNSNISKSELSNEIQIFIGAGNGTMSIGEENQNTLSLTTFDLLPGDYILFTGAYEEGKGLVGIDQKELTIYTGTSPK